MKKRIFNFILVFVFVLTGMVGLVGCGKKGGNNEDKSLAYVNLNINPEIELIVDKNNKVVSVRGTNEDGLVLLYDESGIKGETITTAIDKIVTLAKNYGFIDDENKVVGVIVSSGNDELEKTVNDKIKTTISATAENLGITLTTDAEGAYSLVKKFNEFKAEFSNNQAIRDLKINKFKLALAVSETGEITLESAVLLNDEELVEMLKKATDKIEAYATKEFEKAKAEAYVIYDQLAEIPSYSVYTEYYLRNIAKHPRTAYYGGTYQMYASSAKAFSALCDAVELVASIDDFDLQESQESEVQEILNILGISDITKIQDSDGKITIASIEAYADKLFKNTPASDELQAKKEALNTALAEIEEDIKAQVQELANQYMPKIQEARNLANTALSSVQTALDVLPDVLKTTFSEITTDLSEVIREVDAIISSGNADVVKLRKLTIKLNEKADKYLQKIKADLTEEEFESLESERLQRLNESSQLKTDLNNALSQAEQNAKQKLAELKAKLLPTNENE